MARDFVCIVCPRGCQLHVDDNGNVIEPNWDQLIDLSGGEQ